MLEVAKQRSHGLDLPLRFCQADPELERMRHALRWRYGQFLLWVFSFALLGLVIADAMLPLLPH
jgi:hypothetical protein